MDGKNVVRYDHLIPRALHPTARSRRYFNDESRSSRYHYR